MDAVKSLTINNLYLSGLFGHKFIENIRQNKSPNCPTFLKALYYFDGYEITIDDNNFITIGGLFKDIVTKEVLSKFNNYINNKVSQVKDENYKKKMLHIANLDLSRNSKFHIFNIELLYSAASIKKERFDLLYSLMTDKRFYDYIGQYYEYYLFTIFDVNTYENASEVYDLIIENCLEIYDEDTGYIKHKKNSNSLLKEQLDKYLEKQEQEKINKNLELIKIKC